MKKLLLALLLIVSVAITSAQTFTNSLGLPIPDNNTYVYDTINVSGLVPGNITSSGFGLESVTINIAHPNDADLRLKLRSPDGSIYVLTSFYGGTGDNYTNTTFNDTATTNISTGVAPFTGVYHSVDPLVNFNNNQNANGAWELMLRDQTLGNVGNLISWSLKFSNAPAGSFPFFSSNLPIVLINTNNVAVPASPKLPAQMSIIYNGPGAINHITDPVNDYNGKIGIAIRGHYSASLPQKPYSISLWDSANNNKDTMVLGMPTQHEWDFIANYNDKVFMRNALTYKLFNDMGHWASRTRFCEVVLNGGYQGVYLLAEAIKRDSNRVNINKLDSTENSGLNVTGGYILGNDYWSATDSWLSNFHPIGYPTYDVHFVYEYPTPTSITDSQKTYIQGFINTLETELYDTTFRDTLNGYQKYMGVGSFIDYFISNELARNNDGFKKSVYMHKDKDDSTGIKKLKMGPVWDFDWAYKDIPGCIFGATDGSGWAYHINDCGPDVPSSGWYVRLMQDTAFQNKLRCRWEYLRRNILSDSALFYYVDSVAGYLDSAQARHFRKWGNLGVNTGTPEVEPDPTTFAGEIAQFKGWLSRRTLWLDGNIPGTCYPGMTVNIKKETPENITVYPNPATNTITIRGIKNQVLSIKILDITGRLVNSEQVTGNSTVLDVSGFAKGMYFIQIATSAGVNNCKFVKE